MAVPHGHWKTTTLIAGMRSSGVVALPEDEALPVGPDG